MGKHTVRMKCDKPNCDHPLDIEVDLPEPKPENENIPEEPKTGKNNNVAVSVDNPINTNGRNGQNG